MTKFDLKFLALKQLDRERESIKAYDNYSEKEMLDSYIEKNGFNPQEEYDSLYDVIFEDIKDRLPNRLVEIVLCLEREDFMESVEKVKKFEEELLKHISKYKKYRAVFIVNFLRNHFIKG